MLHPSYGLRDQGITTDYGADWALHGVSEFLDYYTDGPGVYDDGVRAFAQAIYSNAVAKGGGRLFLDKTPRYLMILDDLLRLFPAAKFIFLIRNPLSVLASIVTTQISHDLSTLERFRQELLDGPDAMLASINQLGDTAIVLRYEDYVTAPEKHTRAICDQLGLTYQDGMVDYSNSPAIEGFMQDRTGVQQHKRPNDGSLESWKKLLSDPTHIHYAQNYLRALGRDTVNALGYSYDELHDTVRSASERVRGPVVLEWRTALLRPSEMRGMDQLAVTSYRMKRDFGPVQARIKIFVSFWRAMWTQFRWIFGRTP